MALCRFRLIGAAVASVILGHETWVRFPDELFDMMAGLCWRGLDALARSSPGSIPGTRLLTSV